MHKKILTILMMTVLILSISITGCTFQDNENNTGNDENNQTDNKEELDRKNFKSFYVEGNYSEELYELQKNLDEDEVYYNIIDTKENFDKEVEKYNLSTPRMEYSLNYDKDYFKDKGILFVYPSQGSSSISYTVKKVKEYTDNVDVLIEKYLPNEGTTDMINHGLLIEIHGQSVNNEINIEIEETKPPSEE